MLKVDLKVKVEIVFWGFKEGMKDFKRIFLEKTQNSIIVIKLMDTSTNFFTNQDQNTPFNKFEGVFKLNKTISQFAVNVASIRILVNIDVDIMTAQMQSQGLAAFKDDSKKTIDNCQQKFNFDIQQADYDQQTEHGIKQFIADMQTDKLQLKARPSQNIHAKIYIFLPNDFNQHASGSTITGSSNLTNAALGSKQNTNYKFNLLLNDYEDIKFATSGFEKMWDDGVEILAEMVESDLKQAHLAANNTSYELYLKYLLSILMIRLNLILMLLMICPNILSVCTIKSV